MNESPVQIICTNIAYANIFFYYIVSKLPWSLESFHFHIQMIDPNHHYCLWATYYWMKSLNIFVPEIQQTSFYRIYNIFLHPNVKRAFVRYDDISIIYSESTLGSTGQKINNFIISNGHTKISTNYNNLFSSTENKIQLVWFLWYWYRCFHPGNLFLDWACNRNKYISGCHLTSQSLGKHICRILPALHSQSGCDSTSRLEWKAALLDFVQKGVKHLGNPNPSVTQLTELETLCTYLFPRTN